MPSSPPVAVPSPHGVEYSRHGTARWWMGAGPGDRFRPGADSAEDGRQARGRIVDHRSNHVGERPSGQGGRVFDAAGDPPVVTDPDVGVLVPVSYTHLRAH